MGLFEWGGFSGFVVGGERGGPGMAWAVVGINPKRVGFVCFFAFAIYIYIYNAQ